MTAVYRWRGGTEHVVRLGDTSLPALIVLPALFEEGNRMRHFTVSVMRALLRRGIGTVMPDLPGTGESLMQLCDVTLDDWRDAVDVVANDVAGSIAIRGGALLDSGFERRFRLAPESGERVMRNMVRATAFSSGMTPKAIDAQARTAPMRLAGNSFSPHLYAALCDAVICGDASESQIDGPKLWRAAEPGDAPQFADAVAAEIADWVKTCVR